MTTQDFSKKAVIVVRRDLESWQITNTIAHCAAYIGNKLRGQFDTGEFFTTKDGVAHPRNSQYPIIVLEGTQEELRALSTEARTRSLLHLDFFREMIETTDDTELQGWLDNKEDKDLEYMGVGVFGDKEVLKQITGKFKLWK